MGRQILVAVLVTCGMVPIGPAVTGGNISAAALVKKHPLGGCHDPVIYIVLDVERKGLASRIGPARHGYIVSSRRGEGREGSLPGFIAGLGMSGAGPPLDRAAAVHEGVIRKAVKLKSGSRSEGRRDSESYVRLGKNDNFGIVRFITELVHDDIGGGGRIGWTT